MDDVPRKSTTLKEKKNKKRLSVSFLEFRKTKVSQMKPYYELFSSHKVYVRVWMW